MTFLSSPSRLIRSQIVAPLLLAAVILPLGACEDKHIGRPCDIGVLTVADPKLITVNTHALECPSRICVLPAMDRTTSTGAFCTDECASDDDCADGEKGNSKDPTDKRCLGGFACRRIVPKLDGNPIMCKPICVCKDFLVTNDPNMKPPSCP
jgi:hypothetical protein